MTNRRSFEEVLSTIPYSVTFYINGVPRTREIPDADRISAARMQISEEEDRATAGRKKINHEQTPARFPLGTLATIDDVAEDGESRADFIREAVKREIQRRRERQN
jgi:hypothetical protein